ncbi:MAG: tetratricopeptide repeat protein, partial [Candidatus Thorarchaeota archaeon]
MASKTDKINAYIDLISSSLDTDTLNQPDFKYIVHKISREDFEDAKRRCLLRIQNHDDEALSWALYGLTLMLQAEVKKAGEALLKAATIEPSNLLVMNLMGDYLCFAGKDLEGEDVYYRSLSIDDGQLHPRKMLFFQFMSRNEYLQAREVVIPALQTSPDDEGLWTSIKTALAMMGSHDYAEEVAESLTEKFKDQPSAWRFKAHVYLV